MDINRRMPIGIELVRRGVVTENQINEAVEYQRNHRKMKIGEILRETTNCDEKLLIETIGEILGEKGIILNYNDITLNVEEYISLDIIKECRSIPFSIAQGKIRVCFSDTANKNNVEKIRLLLLNKGLIMEKYITFQSNIDKIINMLDGKSSEDININADNIKLIE